MTDLVHDVFVLHFHKPLNCNFCDLGKRHLEFEPKAISVLAGSALENISGSCEPAPSGR